MGRRKFSNDEVRQGLRQVYPRMWRFCLALTGSRDSAQDLAQSACLRALEKSNLFEPGTQFDRWMFILARRLWLNEMRSAAVRRGGGLTSIDDLELPDDRPGPDSNIFATQVLKEVMALPEAQRAVVILVYVEGYRYKEAAEILEIPIGTVMSRLAAARSTLAATFRHEESETG